MNSPGHDSQAAQRPDEIFDVVDEHDVPVARATRAEVHALRLRHRAVHVLVFGTDGRVFLQQRSRLKDTSPGLWNSSCSGHLDAGEEYDAAAVRELAEEIGLVVTPATRLVRLVKLTPSRDSGWEFAWVYEARGDGPFTLHPEEISEGRWLTPGEIIAWIGQEPEAFASAARSLWTEHRAVVLAGLVV